MDAVKDAGEGGGDDKSLCESGETRGLLPRAGRVAATGVTWRPQKG